MVQKKVYACSWIRRGARETWNALFHWSGMSVFENPVRTSKWMCEVCVRYKKLHEDVPDWTESLAFTALCSRAETEDFENDSMLPDSSSESPFLQNAINAVVNRILGKFTRVAENPFSLCFFDLHHPGFLQPYLFPSIY